MDAYATSNLGWQLRLLLQRLGEAWEFFWSRWQWQPADSPQWTLPEPLRQVLLGLILAGLGLWLAWMLYRMGANWWHQPGQWQRRRPTSVSTSQAASSPVRWQQAQHWAQQGDYRQACHILYLAALQYLHQQQHLPANPSYTDGDYLDQVSQLAQPRPYQLLIRTHERLEFGNHPAAADTYERCRRAFQEIMRP
ncbi:hypothetical protein XM38_046040 [Halomicronema hongdechloris C2206]|uniref:Protein-glutamine gamma-glutamyltransferase-like C-terminal domain-containing protein n=1 Tax=Halomicronema hongdechloris C2206 TaxID=1641165 RepID=A0A1Z3HTK7_9CYAN|nr:DUF4129 domain-containing protein [Halomicronema hongdechloris]ASC73633.1 hypothetical protein XM38_046040 [Halomicronema hongdechloris C2206]